MSRIASISLFLVGIAVGAATTYVLSNRNKTLVVGTPNVSISDGTTTLRSDAVQFETEPATAAVPLTNLPLTARVALIDAKTGPCFAPLEGRVTEVRTKLGDQVKKGERLVLVSSAELSGIARDYQAAGLAVRTKHAMFERTKLLVEARAASMNDLIVAESELDEAKLTSASTGAKLRSLNVTQSGDSSYWVVANRDGVIVQLETSRGKEVGPDKERPVATVADLDEVLVIADLPARSAAQLTIGASVEIRRPSGTTSIATGKLDRIADAIDAERQTVPVNIRVPNIGHVLRPNEFVEATIVGNQLLKVVTVPTSAVVSDGALSVVFVEESKGKFVRRLASLGRQTPDRTEIVSGVNDNERVVTRGALLLLNAVGSK
jgi:membrane fusion protein, heavy metal efflux system